MQSIRAMWSDRLIRGGSWLFGIKLAGILAAFALQVTLARILGVSEFGIYTFVMTCTTLAAIPATLGLPIGLVKLVAESREKKNWGSTGGLLRWGRVVPLAAGTILFGAATLFVMFSDGAEKFGLPALVAGLAGIPLLAVLRCQMALARGFEWPLLAFAPELLARPLILIGLSLILYSLAGGVLAVQILILTQITVVFLVVIQGVLLRYRLPREIRDTERHYEQGAWFTVCLPLAILTGFEVVNERVDLLMVGAFLQTSDVGLYHAASRIAGVLLIFLSTANAIVAPVIARLNAAGEREKLQQLVGRVIVGVFVPTALLAVGLVVFSEQALALFGPEFVDASRALQLLCIAQIVNAGAGPVLLLMNMMGLQNESAKIFGVAALVNAGLNALLIPLYEIEGAAVATGVSIILWNVWMALAVRRRLGIASYILGRVPKNAI